ncbi:MAG: deoxyribonuclease V [Dehalococcoidales bacterium]|nr:deoxyribonuclease V [Dehalococcoidales bacterium]
MKKLHTWEIGIDRATELQRQLAIQVSGKSEVFTPRFIGGVDLAVGKAREMATAAVIVLSYPDLKLVETRVVRGKLAFPYVPGYLSFREAPLVLAACEELNITPDLFFVDGQGVAHPRRLGLASHLGLFLDTPAIGCAKSLLCGHYEEPGVEPGSYAEIIDRGEVVGAALRTRPGVKPVYISIGHKIDLKTAIYWTLACCRGYRLPEPARLAHLAAGGALKSGQEMRALEPAYHGK